MNLKLLNKKRSDLVKQDHFVQLQKLRYEFKHFQQKTIRSNQIILFTVTKVDA